MDIKEVIEAAKNDPEFRKGIVMFAKDTEEGKELLNNHFQVEWDKKIGDEISKVHRSYDDDIFEILGVRKKTDQKTYDFVKELANDLKKFKDMKPDDKDAKIKELNDKVKELQDSGSVNEHWKKVYDEAMEKWTQKENELNEKLTAKDQEYLTAQVKADLTAGRSGLKFMDSLPEEAIQAMVNLHEGEILKHAKLVDGKVVYHKPDGTPWMNNEIKPISANEIWSDKLGNIIQTGDNQNRGGAAKPDQGKGSSIVTVGEGDNATKKLVLDKSQFSTKMEFTKLAEKALTGQGIAQGTPEFNKLKDEAYAEYEVDKLDFQ